VAEGLLRPASESLLVDSSVASNSEEGFLPSDEPLLPLEVRPRLSEVLRLKIEGGVLEALLGPVSLLLDLVVVASLGLLGPPPLVCPLLCGLSEDLLPPLPLLPLESGVVDCLLPFILLSGVVDCLLDDPPEPLLASILSLLVSWANFRMSGSLSTYPKLDLKKPHNQVKITNHHISPCHHKDIKR
jgi:hypothetical protein